MNVEEKLNSKNAPEELIERVAEDEINPEDVATLEIEYPDYRETLRNYQSYLLAKEKVRFPIEEYSGSSKTVIAQSYADWLVQHHNTIPVYMNDDYSNRVFFTYIESKGIWKQISYKYVEKLAKEHLGNQFTRHTKQELSIQFKNHPDAIFYENMGLDSNEILLRDKKVYNLEAEDPEDALRDVKPEDYAINRLNASIEFHEPKRFNQFMKETFPDKEERQTVQEFIGWCLKFPDNRFESALLILGETNTGKSTFMKVIRELFRDCRVSELSLSQIGMERRFHLNKIGRSILNLDEDMSSAQINDSSAVKQIISQEDIFVEPKGKEGYNINPTAKLILSSNIAPSLNNEHGAFYQRFRTVEAPNQVPVEEQDRNLLDKLTTPESLNGIFHWALKGLNRLEEQGNFSINRDPFQTKEKWNNYGSDVDKFIAECVEVDKGNHIPTTDVYEYYEMWKSESLDEPMNASEFIKEMKKHPQINQSRKSIHGSSRSCFTNIDVSVLE